MKKNISRIIVFLIFSGFYSCESTFLQMPDITGSSTIETVYSSSTNAMKAIAECYQNTLSMGLPYNNPFANTSISSMSDELSRGGTQNNFYSLPNVGYSATGISDDDYGLNFSAIRADYLVDENIDKVPDMSLQNKTYVKSEMLGLIAYRYMGMFYRYGGLPLVKQSFISPTDAAIPRSSLDSTLNFILDLCDKAIAGLPDKWDDNMTGRLTKTSVMAMKARLLMYAARPLFNSSTPYLDNGSQNNLICFGPTASQNRWNLAIDANLAALNSAQAQGNDIINTGGEGVGQPNPNAFADYGTATSTPANSEILLAYKWDNPQNGKGSLSLCYNYSGYAGSLQYLTQQSGVLYNFFKNYYNADGTEANWPQPGDAAARPATDYLQRTAALEPRFKADNIGPGFGAANNPGDVYWNLTGWGPAIGNYAQRFPRGVSGGGCSKPTKFYYHAFNRVWFEMPLFRVAEIYLNLAEAYNEVGNSAKALQYLNVVHNRAGLPSITETDQTKLRAIIQREWAIEFFMEGQRLFQVKHWKLANIGTEILGGPVMEFEFQTLNSSNNLPSNLISYWNYIVYNKFWHPRMFLDPIPQLEVNKGIVSQNPGY